jgi:hypothetical protein
MQLDTSAAFATFAKGLVPFKPSMDPDTITAARVWYDQFAGPHAVNMDDQDLVEIYEDLS